MKNVDRLCQPYCYNLSLNSVYKLIESFNPLLCLSKKTSIINSFCQRGYNDMKFLKISYRTHQKDDHSFEALLSIVLHWLKLITTICFS